MAKQQKTIITPFAFPVRGLDENWARQDQPPLTTADCSNVWPFDRLQRARGARRPGLSRLFADPVGGGIALYRRARRCSDNGLASIVVPVAEITTAYPFNFRWNGDGACYYVLESEPALPNPTWPVATQRTVTTGCGDALCDGAPPGNPPRYRAARKCSNPTQFSPLWVNAEWTGGASEFYFRFEGDGVCYKVLDTDPLFETAGTTAVNRTPVVDCASPLCSCVSASCGTFASSIGPLVEHARGGSSNWIQRSAVGVVCTNGASLVKFTAASDDLVILVHESDFIGQTYSGVKGDPVTITIPDDAILFRDTTGWFMSQAEALGPATVAKTLTDGVKSYTWPAGTAANHGTGHVVDCEAGGFSTRPWSQGVTVAELAARGWIDADGFFRFRFALIPSGSGRLQITSALCSDQPLYRQARRCSDNTLADVWIADTEVTTFPFTFVVNAPPPGTAVSTSYVITGDEPPSAAPGTIYAAASYTVAAGGCNGDGSGGPDGDIAPPGNQHRRVRRCSDDGFTGEVVKADTVGSSLPASFRPGGQSTCVYLDPADGPVVAGASPVIPYENATTGCSDPACAQSDLLCLNCPDSTPGRVNVVFDSVTLCTACTGSDRKIVGSLTNYCAVQRPDSPCEFEVDTDLYLHVFPNVECTGTPTVWQFRLLVTRSGNDWTVTLTLIHLTNPPDAEVFSGATTTVGCTGASVSNTFVGPCGGVGNARMGFDGTATISIVTC